MRTTQRKGGDGVEERVGRLLARVCFRRFPYQANPTCDVSGVRALPTSTVKSCWQQLFCSAVSLALLLFTGARTTRSIEAILTSIFRSIFAAHDSAKGRPEPDHGA
ncbi:hypothetical protein BV25DRAFT_1820448 [Artomyces pyxidatus]|uniref:Uncharacterized protein n=1 Tax=Artomyces pyxidatus TaxID=48021 RepID=A0ACB8TDJ5_9AGAM|nr:hypothetical protein BV25DRAFT_1820448 [Artomyces pyxidatus]